MNRLWTLVSLILVVPAGFASKLLAPQGWWIRDHGAGALYVIFWILAASFVWPTDRAAKRIALWALGVTCCLEFLQLWHPPILQQIRATFIGALLGWLWTRAIFSSTRTP